MGDGREEDEERLLSEDEDIQVEIDTIEIPPVVHSGILGKFFPFGFWYEFKMLVKLAIPIMITSLVAFMSGPISLIFCGRLGKSALATVGLAISLFNVSGLAVVTGMLTAADTIFSQTYGSGNRQLMSLQLQKTLAIITLCCLPCAALNLLAEPFLISLKQNPRIAKEAAEYILLMVPGLWVAAYGQVLTKYVQSQNHVYAPLIVGILTNCLNALMHYIFLFVLGTGVKGSAIAQVVAYVFQCIILTLYIVRIERAARSWQGYSHKIWMDWGSWFKLAIPGLVMISLEWTIFETGSIVSGTIGQIELATQTILFNVETTLYTLVPIGFGVATSIRLGQFLGAGSAIGPRSVMSVGLVTAWAFSTVFIILLVVLRREIPKIFALDKKVIELTASILPLLAVFQLFDGTVGVCSGAIRGAGLQVVGAAICFITLYILGAPLGLCLVFLGGYKLAGLWVGLTLGTVLEGIVYLIVCYCVNWEKQVQKALQRTEIAKITANDPKQDDSITNFEQGEISDVTDNSPDEVYDQLGGPNTPSTASLCHNSRRQQHVEARLTKVIIAKRIVLASVCSGLFAIALSMRQAFPWSKYLGYYCVYSDDSFVRVVNISTTPDNCTLVRPGIQL